MEASSSAFVLAIFVLLVSLSTAHRFSFGVREEERALGGPGSSPPTCRSKCGWCWPCRAVHVPVQPGFSMTLEYYPEAWRCKCRDKLYMP